MQRFTCLVSALLVLVTLPALAETLAEENARLRAELETARQRIADLEARLGVAEQRVEQATQQVERAEQEVEAVTRQRDRMTQLAGLTVEGDRLDSREALIETMYDAKADRTTVRSQAERLTLTGGSRADTFINVAFNYPGQTPPSAPTGARVVIQTAISDGDYRGAEAVEFVLDGETMSVPIAEYRNQSRSARAGNERRVGRGNEIVLVDLSPEQLSRLAGAVTVVGRIGKVVFALTPDQIATFRAIELRQGG